MLLVCAPLSSLVSLGFLSVWSWPQGYNTLAEFGAEQSLGLLLRFFIA